MRRLDTFTIVIIAVCLIAAGLLIWIGYNKLAGDKEDDKSALYEEIEDDEDGDYYYLDDEDDSDLASDPTGTPDDFEDSGSNIADNTSSSNTSVEDDASYEVVDKNDEEEVLTPRSYSSAGRYLVLAGSFRIQSNADNYARTIRNKGYSSTSVERFDNGVYAVVLVDRFNSLSDAQALVRKLENDGVDSYVKKN
ncbi:MAG: SPOR domain-containing protein [Bacteroidota bacterium]